MSKPLHIALPHVNLMMIFSKQLNAIILVRRGHVLQVALIYTRLTAILYIIRSRRLAASHNHIYMTFCIDEEPIVT